MGANNFALGGALMLVSAAAGASPQVAFAEGDGTGFAPGESVRIERGGLQLRLGPETWLDAGAGTEFLLEVEPAGRLRLRVARGNPVAIDTGRNRVQALPPGSYSFDAAGMLQPPIIPPDAEDAIPGLPLRQPDLMLAEIVLTQEAEYLKRIQINPIDLGKGIFNLIRGIFGAR